MSTAIKQIKEELKEIDKEINKLLIDRASLESKLKAKVDKKAELEEKIESIKKQSGQVTLSDHAILRYLERVEKVDVEAVRKKILTGQLKEFVAVVGNNGKFPIKGGKAIIKNGVIVTVEVQ